MSPSTAYSRDLEAGLPSASSPHSASPSASASSSPSGALCCLSTSRSRWVLLAVLLVAAAVLLLLPPFIRLLVSGLSVLDASPTSAALFFVVLVLLCSPFTLGYGVVVLTAGLVFGWWAFPLVYCASVVGGSVWFVVFRWLSAGCGCNVSSLLFSLCPGYSLYLRAFTSALESYPVRSAALLQLSFLPFGALCALLSSTELRLASFVLACCVSRIKLLAYISLAQSAGTVHALWTRDASSPARWQDALTLCVSVVCSIVALSTISVLASRQLKRMREDGSSTAYSLQRDNGAEAEADEQRRPAAADDNSGELRESEYNRLLSPRGSRGGGSDSVRLDVRDVPGDASMVRHFGDSQHLLALHDGSVAELQAASPQLDALSSLSDSARVRKLSGSTVRSGGLPATVAATPSSPLSSSVSSLPLRSSSPRRLRADSPSSSRLLLSSSIGSSSIAAAAPTSSSSSSSSRRRPSDAANPTNAASQAAITASYPFLLHHSASHSPLHANQHSHSLSHTYSHPHSPRRKVSATLQSNGR